MLHCVAKKERKKGKKGQNDGYLCKNELCYFSERMCLPHFGAWNTLCKNICIKDVSKDLVEIVFLKKNQENVFFR